jgi:hypothetical protein
MAKNKSAAQAAKKGGCLPLVGIALVALIALGAVQEPGALEGVGGLVLLGAGFIVAIILPLWMAFVKAWKHRAAFWKKGGGR